MGTSRLSHGINHKYERINYVLHPIDHAACDLVFAAPDSKDVIKRIESRHGLRQLSAMVEKKMGNPQYQLIVVNKISRLCHNCFQIRKFIFAMKEF